MFTFHYEHMKAKYPHADQLKLLLTDTDSLAYAVQIDNICQDISIDASEKYDLSEYPVDHPLYNTSNRKAIGFFKDELNAVSMEEIVGLRPKCYAFMCTGKVCKNAIKHTNPVEKETANGVKRKVKDAHFHFNHYLDALHSFQSFVCKQNLISSTSHTVRSVHQRKVSLTAFDTKRWLCEVTIHTYSHGHLDTTEFAQDIRNSSFITCTIAEAAKRLKTN